jgi:flagellar M-ring protein FliF
VKSAIVHISAGKDSPFADEVVPPSAVVNLQLSSGNALGGEESKAIARLIQHAVPGLSAKNVSVIDSAGRLLYDGQEEGSPSAMGNKKLQAEIAESRRREAELQRRLDVAFGPGNTVVSVQVTLDMDQVDEEKRDFALGDKKVVEQATETMAAPPSTPLAGNPSAASERGGGSASPSYSSTVTSNQFPSTETHTRRTKALGALTGMYVSVIANSSKVSDPATVQSILDDYLGDRRGQPGFTASVQSVEFDTSAAADAKPGASAGAPPSWMGLLPVGALVLVGVLLSKSVGKALSAPRPAPQRRLPAGLEDPGPRSPAMPSVADAARTLASDPDIAAALKEAGLEPMDDFDGLDDSVDVQDIRRRVDVPLEQIKKLAKRRPETVAMLLKGWLLEERA